MFGYVDALSIIAYNIQQNKMIDLKIAGKLEFNIDISIASRKNDPILNSIMQKGLDNIEKKEIQSIIGKWVTIKLETSMDYTKLLYISIFFLSILLVVLYKNRSINKVNKQLEELMFVQNRMAALGNMIENIAHQWKQPLSSINASILLIDKKMSNFKEYDLIEKDIDSIELTTVYLSKTIDDIRNFYSQDKIKKEFYIYDVIADTMDILSGLFISHKISIQKNIDKGLMINSFPNELQQVVISVILNAKDAIIKNNTQNPKIIINLFKPQEDSKIKLQIIDNGGGIEEKNLYKIFEPYFTTKKDYNGTGIGLYITQMIIKQSLGGTINATNTQDGACFEIILPL